MENPIINFLKSSFNSFAEVFISSTIENNDVTSAKIFAWEVKLSDKSFRQIKNNNGPGINSCGTPAWTFVHEEFWPVSTTICLQLLKK